MKTTVQEATDKSASTEHVFGATALTPAEWELLDAKPHGVFVLEERTHSGVTLMDHEYPTRAAVYAHVHELIEQTPATFWPRGPIRLVVTQVTR